MCCPELESLDAAEDHLRRLQPNATDQALAHQAAHLTAARAGGGRTWRVDPAALASRHDEDLWEAYRGIRCPKLLVRGRQSRVMPHELAVRMREAGPRVRLAELESAGHWVHQVIPGAFEATVRWFLQTPP